MKSKNISRHSLSQLNWPIVSACSVTTIVDHYHQPKRLFFHFFIGNYSWHSWRLGRARKVWIFLSFLLLPFGHSGVQPTINDYVGRGYFYVFMAKKLKRFFSWMFMCMYRRITRLLLNHRDFFFSLTQLLLLYYAALGSRAKRLNAGQICSAWKHHRGLKRSRVGSSGGGAKFRWDFASTFSRLIKEAKTSRQKFRYYVYRFIHEREYREYSGYRMALYVVRISTAMHNRYAGVARIIIRSRAISTSLNILVFSFCLRWKVECRVPRFFSFFRVELSQFVWAIDTKFHVEMTTCCCSACR
jgi:hypothetical protein